MTDSTPRVAMVAGETSGDLLAGLLLDGLKNVWPDVSAHGIGGAQMAQRGFAAWWPSEKLAVHGYSFEVLRRLREIIGIRKQLRTRLLADKPDVFIGVDAPDFNLGLEADLRAAGVKTVHFVCPSIWAWRAERIEKIRRSVDHVLCIFPFEPELLARHGIAATYVGHPLAAVIPLEPDRAGARKQLGLADDDQVLAILPGILALLYPDAQYLLIIRVMRMLRVFRVLKLSPYLRQANFLLTALRGSKQKIIVFFACISTMVIVFGTLMYVIEGPSHGFTSIPTGIYWAVVTLTTVGFGDITPKTPLGQAVATLVMITGYSIIAVPTGIFTAELASAMREETLQHACPVCRKANHEPQAAFCSRCGNPLFTRETPPQE